MLRSYVIPKILALSFGAHNKHPQNTQNLFTVFICEAQKNCQLFEVLLVLSHPRKFSAGAHALHTPLATVLSSFSSALFVLSDV